MRKARVLSIVVVSILLAVSCGSPGGGIGSGGGENPVPVAANALHLTGTVHDSLTGAALPGVLVRFGTTTESTGTDGEFDLLVETSSEVVTAAFSVTKAGYRFIAVIPASFSSGTTYTLPILLSRSNYASYSSQTTLNGQIYASTGKEIGPTSRLWIYLYGKNGTFDYHAEVPYEEGGYSIETPLVNDDCLVLIRIQTGSEDFAVAATGVSLSGSGSRTLSLTASASDWAQATIAAAGAGNVVRGVFLTDYGQVPALIQDAVAPGTVSDLASELTLPAPDRTVGPDGPSILQPFAMTALRLCRPRSTEPSGTSISSPMAPAVTCSGRCGRGVHVLCYPCLSSSSLAEHT